ncbi:hypothetical protein [Chakrabartyella piscis]|uniref:hypothetical protein n=1 Tax=Chakrabartyella piscis TaxID=2918914 RepID=UPI002958321A|nr:hypothetical protein [Chakrabartyella piscis]
MKKRILFGLTLTLALAGCGSNTNSTVEETTATVVETEALEEEVVIEDVEEEIVEEETSGNGMSSANLYISLGGEPTSYPFSYTGNLTPELLLTGMSALTGWDLSLDGKISSGKGGMTVAFADTSSLVVGPPEEQKDEFFCFDTYQLAESILNSVMYTLQYNYVDAELGDPSSLDIYFCGADDAELYIPQIDLTVSMYEPYDGSLME